MPSMMLSLPPEHGDHGPNDRGGDRGGQEHLPGVRAAARAGRQALAVLAVSHCFPYFLSTNAITEIREIRIATPMMIAWTELMALPRTSRVSTTCSLPPWPRDCASRRSRMSFWIGSSAAASDVTDADAAAATWTRDASAVAMSCAASAPACVAASPPARVPPPPAPAPRPAHPPAWPPPRRPG